MRRALGFVRRGALVSVLPVCLLSVACGSSGDGSAAVSAADVLTEAPHCPSGANALKIEGAIDSGAIDDTRTTSINAGYQNVGMPKFSASATDANQLAVTIDWAKTLFNGQTGAITGGNLTLPANHPNAGAQFCVTAGHVGFVSGGAEDSAFKFDVTQVKAGADCSGAATAVDLRGCDNY
jgi:hypothetical protein